MEKQGINVLSISGMKRELIIAIFVFATCVTMVGETTESQQTLVSGKVNVGLSTELNTDQDQIDFVYTTNDPRLGTNSENHYFSTISDVSQNVHAVYGAELNVDIHSKHKLDFSFEGANDREHAMGTREEQLMDKNNLSLSHVKGLYNHPNELSNELKAGVAYTYLLPRKGESISFGYGYQWENESAGVEQEIMDATGWSLYKDNVLEQKINKHFHHANIDYVCPVAKGHLLDFGLAYDRRELSVNTEQDWDKVRVLEADYRHLTQYGGVHARYRLKLGPVEAMARLEYRATKMQNRWLHDVLPTATIRYSIDTIHSLSAFYTIMLIRPDVNHLDTTHIVDTYTESFGNNDLVGVHVHNVALTYRMQLPRVKFSTEVRYLTANDGLNAIWMERGNRRIYTWGNEGVRHAVGLTPTIDSHLGKTTDLHFSATVMWDKRVAAAINLENPNWGLRAQLRLSQLVYAAEPASFFLVAHGNYSFHNTLDVYSYEGHGGQVGLDGQVRVSKGLNMSVGYTCFFKPDIHIVQGAYVGTIPYRPGATHMFKFMLSYAF